MSRKRKKIKKVQEDENIFENLDTQNRALMKILKKLKNGRQQTNNNNQ